MNNNGVTILVILEATSLAITVGAIGFAYFSVRKAKREMQKKLDSAQVKVEKLKRELRHFASVIENL